jgi:hypothetical protein
MEQYRFVERIMEFPALTLMVLLRRDIGYRMLNPFALGGVTGLVFVIAVLATPGNEAARPMDLAFYAVAVFILGMAQRIRRWWQLNQNERQHSYYIGSSPFDFRWLPNFVRRNRRVARFIDPIVCMLIGLALIRFSPALGGWLIFSAFALRSFEYSVHCHKRNRQLDLVDGLVVSERQADIIEQYEQGPWSRQRTEQGIPTGMDDDVRENIKRRRK